MLSSFNNACFIYSFHLLCVNLPQRYNFFLNPPNILCTFYAKSVFFTQKPQFYRLSPLTFHQPPPLSTIHESSPLGSPLCSPVPTYTRARTPACAHLYKVFCTYFVFCIKKTLFSYVKTRKIEFS